MQKHLQVAATVAVLALSAPALAQVNTATTAATTTPVVQQERGFDWGWLGLLGLLGLAGLSRREPERVHTQTTQSTHTNPPAEAGRVPSPPQGADMKKPLTVLAASLILAAPTALAQTASTTASTTTTTPVTTTVERETHFPWGLLGLLGLAGLMGGRRREPERVHTSTTHQDTTVRPGAPGAVSTERTTTSTDRTQR